MKHTTGEVIAKFWKDEGVDFYHIRSKKMFTKLIATVHKWKGQLNNREAKANAELITEAFNVTNESSFTPRQLLEQRDELLEELRLLLKYVNGVGNEFGYWPEQEQLNDCKYAIQKATK